MESDLTQLDNRIDELRVRLNKMEMLSEIGKTDIRKLASNLYFDSIVQGMNQAVSDAIDAYIHNTDNCLLVANKILGGIGLEQISPSESSQCMDTEDIFNEYISRFPTVCSVE